MERSTCYSAIVAVLDNAKLEVKAQLATEQSRLVDGWFDFVLDRVNECFNVPTTANAATHEWFGSNGSVSAQRALANGIRVEKNEQTNLFNPQATVEEHVSRRQTLSSTSPSLTTYANIEVKVESVSSQQSSRLCKRVKKEENYEGEMMDWDGDKCGCDDCIGVKREVKDDQTGGKEFERNNGEALRDCVRVKKEEDNDDHCGCNDCVGTEAERPKMRKKMDKVTGEVDRLTSGTYSLPLSSVPSLNVIKLEHLDDQMTALLTNPMTIEDHHQQHNVDPIETETNISQTYIPSTSNDTNSNVQSKDKPFKCDQEGCLKALDTNSHLNQHFQVVHSDQTFHYPIETCDKVYKSKIALLRHTKKHKSLSPSLYSIFYGIPNAFLSNLPNQSIHQRTSHSNVIENDVSNRFMQLNNYRHLRSVHSNQIFYCPIETCNKTFKCKPYVNQHLLEVHFKKTFPCPVEGCERAPMQYSRSALVDHLKRKHKQNFKMPLSLMMAQHRCDRYECFMAFSSKELLLKHIEREHSDTILSTAFTASIEQQLIARFIVKIRD